MQNVAGAFDFSPFASLPLLDGHTHVWAGMDLSLYQQTLHETGARRWNALSLSRVPPSGEQDGTLNQQALEAKRSSNEAANDFRGANAFPGTYAFGALDYSSFFAGQKFTSDHLVAQAHAIHAQGFDGIKMWEGKPSVYVNLPDHLDSPLYEPYFAWMEAFQFPITLHMADPLRFWDPARAGLEPWSYVGERYPTREEMYAETERILTRHPHLRIIFAHLLFFWDDLPRAARWLDAYPSIMLDLAPGVAGYVQLGENRDAAREFFLRYQDRLVYGTDLGAGPVVNPATPFVPAVESGQAWLVRAFLETEWDMPIPAGVGAVTSQFTGKRLRGIALPQDALEQIYERNFCRVVGQEPRTIQP